MKLNVYSLFDRAALSYGHPFYAINDAVAQRTFYDAVRRADGQMLQQHPDDFELRHIASFDDEKGSFEPALCLTLASARQAVDFWRAQRAELKAEVLPPGDPAKNLEEIRQAFNVPPPSNEDNKGVNDD